VRSPPFYPKKGLRSPYAPSSGYWPKRATRDCPGAAA
jgi:hypothetical protein